MASGRTLEPAKPAATTTECNTELDVDPDDEKTPGASVDLTLRFEPRGCDPTGDDGDLHDEITITLSEEIAIPSGFDEDDVSLRAARRYELRWADVNRNDDEPHEIVLPGCGGWESGSDDDVCDETGLPVTIVLNNLRLPNVPADSDDPYEVTIQWENGPTFRGTVAVDASLEVDGDDEVGYGETIRFEGLGFSDGLTVDLYAISSTSNNMDCSTAGGGSWTRIGSAEVGSNHRFRADVEVGSKPVSLGRQILDLRAGRRRSFQHRSRRRHHNGRPGGGGQLRSISRRRGHPPHRGRERFPGERGAGRRSDPQSDSGTSQAIPCA